MTAEKFSELPAASSTSSTDLIPVVQSAAGVLITRYVTKAIWDTSSGYLVSGGALGTPSSGTLTNCTGLPISSGVSGLGTGVASLLAGTSSGTGGPAGTVSPVFTGTLSYASAISGAFGTIGVSLVGAAYTQTDSTTGAGTVATAYGSVLGANTFATAANAITITNGYNLYVKAPVAGSHVTGTNLWALGADSINSTGTISATSGITGGSITSNASVVAAAANSFLFAGRSRMLSPADGVIEMANNASTGFTGLKLGGTTSSFPYIKVNGAALNFRVADDTADANVTGAAATWSSTDTATAFIPSGSTVPTNGMYLSAANTVSFATNSTIALSISSTRALTISSTAVNPLVVNGGAATTVIGQIQSTGTASQVGLAYFAKDTDGTTANQWFVGVGATVNSSFQMVSGVGSTGTTGNTRFTLTAAGALTLSHYGAGTATFDASGNVTSVSDPSQKIFVGGFSAGLPEILAAADDRYMGLHKWKLESGMETDGIYASFFARDDFPIRAAVSKGANGINSFSDRPVIMALVNAIKTLEARIAELEAAR